MTPLDLPEWHALVKAIRSAPADDLPRLVAADWLEEHGFPEWGQFIRLTVPDPLSSWVYNTQPSRSTDPALDLLRRHGHEWFAPWFAVGIISGRNWLWQRGFPWYVPTTVAGWLGHDQRIARRYPVVRVRLNDRDPDGELPDGAPGRWCWRGGEDENRHILPYVCGLIA